MPSRDAIRRARHGAIRALIEQNAVSRQEELVEKLTDLGYAVTQSSISRDLAELRVGKVSGRYVLPSSHEGSLMGLISGRAAGENLLVLRTEVGAAGFVAARLDNHQFPEVVGSIAGDDTVLVATVNREDQLNLMRRLGLAR